MLRCLRTTLIPAFAFILIAASIGRSEDKPAASGSWGKKGAEMRMEFVDKEILRLSPHGKDEFIVVTCSYTIKDGVVKAKITDLDGTAKEMAKNLLPVGTQFSFTWKIKDDVGTVAEVKGKDAETLKSHLEGEYEKR